jgi:hypothetical protein
MYTQSGHSELEPFDQLQHGCQMAYFQTKNPNLDKFWRVLDIGLFYCHLVYFVVLWYILWYFGIFCGTLVFFVVLWYILWYFGIFCGTIVYFGFFV